MSELQEMHINKSHVISFIIVILIMVINASFLVYKSNSEINAISEEIVRFHVVANSDTTEDQLLKQQVKDEVIEYMKPFMKDCQTVEEARLVISERLEYIKMLSEEVVKWYGKDYQVNVYLDEANFPTKSYGDVVLPAGEYEACRIIIGEGKGENWWCVMYPPLCYVDAASGVVPIEGKEQLKKELNEEQYNLIANNQKGKYKIRFKVVDTMGKIFNKENYKEV